MNSITYVLQNSSYKLNIVAKFYINKNLKE